MPNREARTSMKVVQLREPAAMAAADFYSDAVDLQGWDTCTIVVAVEGTTGSSDTGDKFTPALYEEDDDIDDASDYSAVATADVSGTFTTILAASEHVDVVAYRGSKRYVCVKFTEGDAANDVSANVAVLAILTKSSREPANDISVTTDTPA